MKTKQDVKARINSITQDMNAMHNGEMNFTLYNSMDIERRALRWVLKPGQTISCDRCHGEGFMEEAGMTKCDKCGGEGVIYGE